MNLFQRITNRKKRKEKNTPPATPSAKSANRNANALAYLTSIGFSYPEARAFLIKLNNLNIAEIARNSDITAPTIYAVAYGKRRNKTAQEILAHHLGLPVNDLFPEVEHDSK